MTKEAARKYFFIGNLITENVDNTSAVMLYESGPSIGRRTRLMTTPIPIAPTISHIGQIFVNVKDLDRAISFYRDVLGMQFLFQAPPNMAFFDCGGVSLFLGIAGPPDVDHPAAVIYHQVGDIRKNYETLKDRRVGVIVKPHLVAPPP